MVVLSLLLTPRFNRGINIVVSILYMISIIVSCIGETWAYYIIGSAIEVILLAAIARTAWKWPQEIPNRNVFPRLQRVRTGWLRRY